MKDGSKAWMVLVGSMAFFGLGIAGPALSTAGDWTVREIAQAASGESPQKFAKERAYASQPATQKAVACCAGCGLEWDYSQDRCTLDSQAATRCLAVCAPAR